MFEQLLRLSKHSIIYGLGGLTTSIVGFFLIPVYTRWLTPDDYGVLQIFQSTIGVALVCFGMGLGTALLRSYFHYDEEEERKEVISTVLVFLTTSSLVFSLILIAAGKGFSLLLFNSDEYTFYFTVIFLSLFFDTGVTIALMVFRAKEESVKYVIFSLAWLLLGIGSRIFFLVVLDKGVLGLLEANLLVLVFLYVILVGSIVRNTKLRFSLAKLKGMLSFGLPLVPAGLADLILILSDRYFLQFLSTPRELGLYSLGYNFGLVVQALVVFPFALAWVPFMLSVAKERNAKQIYSAALTYFVLIAMFAVLGLSVLSPDVLRIMATPSFHDAYKVVPLVALSYLLFGCHIVFQVGLYLENKTKYIAFVVGAGAIMNLGLNYLLIPSYGMMGAAVATALSYLILAIGMFFASRRFYPIQYEFGRVTKIFLAAVPIYVGSIYITNDSVIIEGVLKAMTLLAYPALLYLFKFYKPEEIQKGKEFLAGAPKYIRSKIKRG